MQSLVGCLLAWVFALQLTLCNDSFVCLVGLYAVCPVLWVLGIWGIAYWAYCRYLILRIFWGEC